MGAEGDGHKGMTPEDTTAFWEPSTVFMIKLERAIENEL